MRLRLPTLNIAFRASTCKEPTLVFSQKASIDKPFNDRDYLPSGMKTVKALSREGFRQKFSDDWKNTYRQSQRISLWADSWCLGK
ncbi:hypothetical protein [Argonema antarcticum]|uniref:hypothetical protein n=1 Tax=Argonema antarcticum TaxID=2942763 RepID=UPI0020114A8E|nr:hypothetical protein [Argonema antarcticum]MCL1475496.1 hypothetical protein [Argonema antarcticum A004/B2]